MHSPIKMLQFYLNADTQHPSDTQVVLMRKELFVLVRWRGNNKITGAQSHFLFHLSKKTE